MKNVIHRKIMWGDLDSLGIVFYPRYYEWIDAAGHLFFEAIDLNLGQLMKTRKILFGLIETSSRYREPGRYHDDIEIVTELEDLTNKTVGLRHTIKRDQDQVTLVEGYEKRICMDVSEPERFKAIPIPDDLFTLLTQAKGK